MSYTKTYPKNTERNKVGEYNNVNKHQQYPKSTIKLLK